MEIAQLKKQLSALNLKHIAEDGCKKFIDNMGGELPSGYVSDAFDIEFKRVAVIIENAFLLEPYFELEYLLFYSGKEVGSYRYIAALDGEPIDDYLEFYKN